MNRELYLAEALLRKRLTKMLRIRGALNASAVGLLTAAHMAIGLAQEILGESR